MGDWTIVVKGIGAHHNSNYPKDANRMTAKFVKDLKEAGHNVQYASFTHGSNDNISDPDQYIENRNKYENPEKK